MKKASPGGACVSGWIPLISSSLSLMSVLAGFLSVYLSCVLHWGWSKSIWRRATCPITTLTCSQTWWPDPPWSRVIRGILVHPSPPVQAYLWTTSFIGRISPVYTWGRRDLGSSGVVNSTWRLDSVRIWKLSRTYPDEKPPSLSVLTHRHSLATRKPTRHLLAMPCILVRVGAPYEGRWSIPFHLPRNYGTIFNPRFLNISFMNIAMLLCIFYYYLINLF